MAEERAVTPLSASTVSTDVLVLNNTSVWHSPNKSHQVSLPPGIYPLEAEDDNYLYYGAPGAVLFQVYKKEKPLIDLNYELKLGGSGDQTEADLALEDAPHKPTEQMAEPGGIFLAKPGAAPGALPAGAYVTLDASRKLLTFKLPPQFLALENKEWRRNL